jgi:hypothetical protein
LARHITLSGTVADPLDSGSGIVVVSCRRATLFADPHHKDGHVIAEAVLLKFANGLLYAVCDGLGVEAGARMK